MASDEVRKTRDELRAVLAKHDLVIVLNLVSAICFNRAHEVRSANGYPGQAREWERAWKEVGALARKLSYPKYARIDNRARFFRKTSGWFRLK